MPGQKVITESQGNLFISPIEFFCGDKVIISYDINVDDDFSIDMLNSSEQNDFFYFGHDEIQSLIPNINDLKSISIESISYSLNKNILNFKITCTFWQPGKVDMPEIKIKTENYILNVQFPQIEVSSILEKTHISSIRSYKGPEIIPGSTYIIWVSGILLLGFLAAMITMIVKFSKIKRFYKMLRLKHRYRKNYKRSVSKINLLSKNSANLSDMDFCERLQLILRDFFAVRFSEKIYNMTTPEITKWFTDTFGSLLPDNAMEAIEKFYAVMVRCEYIRFSGYSSKASILLCDERKTLLAQGQEIFDLIEKGIVTE